MRNTKWFWLTVVAWVLLAVLACGNEAYNEGVNSYNDGYETYDNGYETYDDGSGSENESSEEDYIMLPEDCYEDEEYDPVDQMCYPVYECEGAECEAIDDEFYTLVGDLLGEYLSGEEDFAETGVSGEDDAIITYDVQGNKIVNPEQGAITSDLQAYQDDVAEHERIWVLFANLIAANQRQYISRFSLYTDGPDEVMAFVDPDPNDPTLWILHVDIVDAQNPDELTYTLIHEFAHVLTLNETQVAFDTEVFNEPDNETLFEEAEASCPTYFPGEGCSFGESYINAFFDAFWADIYPDWLESDPDSDEFYLAYEDQFVTDYAATNPGEDIAESFTAFVLEPKPDGDTIAEEKVLFFYNYPELVQLRAEIVGRVYSRLRR